MTLSFENDNDFIVYALEKIISYARKHQYIFVAQSIWGIASVIGLTEGLATHIDNLPKRSEVYQEPARQFGITSSIRQVSATPRDLQSDSRIDSDPESDRVKQVVEETQRFLACSKKQRKEFKKKPDPLTRTRSGGIPFKPLTRKQRNRLQAIPKDTLAAHLVERNRGLRVRRNIADSI